MKSLFHPSHKLYHWIHKKIWGRGCSTDFVTQVRDLLSESKNGDAKHNFTPAELFDKCKDPRILHIKP